MDDDSAELSDAQLEELYEWVDKIPLSRVKKRISRDFSDGVLMAEIMKYFYPKLVEIHNYQTCHSKAEKRKNWQFLNWKVFNKLNFEFSDDVIDCLVCAKPGTIQNVLLLVKNKIEQLGSARDGFAYENSPEAGRLTPMKSESIQFTSAFDLCIPEGNTRNSKPIKANKTGNFQSVRSFQRKGSTHSLTNCNTVGGDIVPSWAYQDKLEQCIALEETVEILNAKVRKLENLVGLKDVRIIELQNALRKNY